MKIKKMTIVLFFLLLAGCGTGNHPASLMPDGIDFFVSGKEERKDVPVVYPAEFSSSPQGSQPGVHGPDWKNVGKEYPQYRFNEQMLPE